MLRERHWLLSAIVIGAVVFWLCTEYVAFYAAVVITVVIVVGLRVMSIRLDWTDRHFPGAILRPKIPSHALYTNDSSITICATPAASVLRA